MKYYLEDKLIPHAELKDERMIGGIVLGDALELIQSINEPSLASHEIRNLVTDFLSRNDIETAEQHAKNTKRILKETWAPYACSHCGSMIMKYVAAVKNSTHVFCDKDCMNSFKSK